MVEIAVVDFLGLGWCVRLRRVRNNHSVSIVRELVLGNGLKKGEQIYYYLVNVEGRKALLLYLDGKERHCSKHTPEAMSHL